MIAQAMDAANVVWEDKTLRQDLTTFAKDYIKAQHAVELTNLGGGAALEVVITAILAALTAGAGLAIATAAKARHLPKLRKLGNLLLEFAEQSKKLARYLKEKAKRAAKGKPDKPLDTEPVVERVNEPPRGGQNRSIKELKTNPKNIREAARNWPPEKKQRFELADNFYKEAGYEDYDNHLRGIDFDRPVEVKRVAKGEKLYQYSYPDRVTGEMKVGSYFYADKNVDPSKLGFDIEGRDMIELSNLEDADVLKSTAANIEDWNESSKVFPGGETQLFNPNLKLSSPKVIGG